MLLENMFEERKVRKLPNVTGIDVAMNLIKKKELRQKRIWRTRKRVRGSAEKPRVCVHFSNKHIYAQLIDDEMGATLLSLTTLSGELREKDLRANVGGAETLGQLFGEKAKDLGLGKVVFDRNGRRYHGAVKAFADSARKAGLQF